MIRYLFAVLFVFVVKFSVNAQTAAPQKLVINKILAAVGDRIVMKSDIDDAISDVYLRNGQQPPPDAPCQILEQSIITKILALQAERDSLPVSDEEVEANLDMRVRGWIMQFGSAQAVEDLAGKTIYQLKEDSKPMIKEQMLFQAMQKKIVENVHITPTEVKAFFEKVPADSIPFLESEVEIGQINIYPKAAKEVEDYIYNEMLSYRKQIEAGTVTFEDLAKRYSEDPQTKERGGFLEINRNDKQWDPIFMSAAFRLKAGETSMPFKSPQFGFFLVQCQSRRGDDAKIRYLLRIPPVTETEIAAARVKLDSVRKEIVSDKISFKDAAYKYSEDEAVKSYGPFVLNNDGSTYVTMDQLPDKDMLNTVGSMKVGEYSEPVAFTNAQGKKGVRIIYLKSRTEPHRMNLQDDYSKIADMALMQKKNEAMDEWLTKNVPSFYVLVDKDAVDGCPSLKKYQSNTEKGF